MRPLLLLLLLSSATGDDTGSLLDATLLTKEAISLELAETIGADFETYQAAGGSACEAYDSCAPTLKDPVCDTDWGSTVGCECGGRAVDTTNSVVMAATDVTEARDVKNAVCYTDDLDPYMRGVYEAHNSELKWLYYGTAEGVLVNYPGFHWCSASYDPRVRPWYVMGATGPKDLFLIIDRSGSMKNHGRMDNAKAAAKLVVSTLTHTDYMNVVQFSTTAYSENTYLVPAESLYRSTMSSFIDDMMPSGYTYYTKAMDLAFEIADRSDGEGFTTNCTRIFIFVSDGEPSEADGTASFVADIEAARRPTDMFFLIGLGAGVEAATLQAAACAIGGIYIQVADDDADELNDAMASYYQYLALGNMINEVQPVRWSEPYESIPDIWGPVTTAVTPVYDKRADPWTMIGVAAVDMALCELEAAAVAAGVNDDDDDAVLDTSSGCVCDATYTCARRAPSLGVSEPLRMSRALLPPPPGTTGGASRAAPSTTGPSRGAARRAAASATTSASRAAAGTSARRTARCSPRSRTSCGSAAARASSPTCRGTRSRCCAVITAARARPTTTSGRACSRRPTRSRRAAPDRTTAARGRSTATRATPTTTRRATRSTTRRRARRATRRCGRRARSSTALRGSTRSTTPRRPPRAPTAAKKKALPPPPSGSSSGSSSRSWSRAAASSSS